MSQLVSHAEHADARAAGHASGNGDGPAASSVLLVTTVLGGGGAEKHLLRVANHLDRSRFRVSLALVKPEGEFESALAPDVKKFHLNPRREGSTTVRALRSVAPLRGLIERERPDLVFSVIDLVNLLSVYAARNASPRPKVVLGVQTPLSIAYDSWHPVSKLILGLMPRMYPSADAVVALSKGVAEDLAALVPRTRGRVTVIHNAGVEPGVREMAREPLPAGERPGGPLVVACGRLKPLKGFAHLIDALAEVRKTVPAHLWIVGEGEQRAELERKVERLGLKGCVRLLGFRQNPYKYMAAADVFVLSSLFEGFGNVIVEAMACGTPVVATDCPYGPREIIRDGESGILVEPASADSLARGISRVLADAELKRRLAANGFERARDFEAEAIAGEYGELFLRVADGGAATRAASGVRVGPNGSADAGAKEVSGGAAR
ncbi:MAG TPA: glycosyltransferase [Pyrinomonadaceae bacterium]|nr:glycosyltransferase [Pyrinomonadaceae bacterium]